MQWFHELEASPSEALRKDSREDAAPGLCLSIPLPCSRLLPLTHRSYTDLSFSVPVTWGGGVPLKNFYFAQTSWILSSSSSLISLSVLALSTSRSRTDFGQAFNCVKIVQMVWSAASARALLAASPIASVEPTARGERITEWLKITAVPLLVFLIGACIWGCIKNTATWRVLTEDGGGSTHNEGLGEVRSDSPRAISNNDNEAAKDLEAGLELSQVRCRDEESDSSLKSTA